MIKYAELVEYIKRNHVNWNADLFDVLKGFFEEYSHPLPPSSSPDNTMPTDTVVLQNRKFIEPEGGEYTSDDLFNLFST